MWLQHVEGDVEEPCGERREVHTICGELQWTRRRFRQSLADSCAELEASMGTWNVKRIKRALQKVKFADGCPPCPGLIRRAEKEVWYLEVKLNRILASGVLQRGNVDIDFDAGVIKINKEIPFDAKTPPEDPTANFKDEQAEKDAAVILKDLAEVVATFDEAVVIEGHTGGTEPHEYWQALGNNRAARIVEEIERCGVRDEIAIPRGVPGGGVYFHVRKATLLEADEEMFATKENKLD